MKLRSDGVAGTPMIYGELLEFSDECDGGCLREALGEERIRK
jgi:hypothetical protein